MAWPRIKPLGVDRERRAPPSTFRRCPLQKRAASSAIERGKARPANSPARACRRSGRQGRQSRRAQCAPRAWERQIFASLRDIARRAKRKNSKKTNASRELRNAQARLRPYMARRKRWPSSGACRARRLARASSNAWKTKRSPEPERQPHLPEIDWRRSLAQDHLAR